MQITIKINEDYTPRELGQLFRQLHGHGIDDQVLSNQTGMTTERIHELRVEARPKSNRINYFFEKTCCPYQNCQRPILGGDVSFSVNDDDNREKTVHGYCIHCLRPVEFNYIKNMGLFCATPVIGIYKVTEFRLSSGMGCQAITDIYCRVNGSGEHLYEMRVGVTMMGPPNFKSSEDACPFDPNYHDNYCVGFGASMGEAFYNLDKDLTKMRDLLLG